MSRRRRYGELSDHEFHRFTQTTEVLRAANREIADKLRSLIGCCRTKKEYDAIGSDLADYARQIQNLVQERELLLSGSVNNDVVFNVIIGPACSKCDHGLTEMPSDSSSRIREIDRTHVAEIDSLVALAHETQATVRVRFVAPAIPPSSLFLAIGRLIRAQLRVRRHLLEIAPEADYHSINLIERFPDRCERCGEPF